MKKVIFTITLLLASLGVTTAQTTATNFTAQDCNSVNHTLFNTLDSGKVVVMVWVMPCGSCVNGAKAAYNAAQSFATRKPGKVLYYIADDMGDASCSTLNTWITSNSIGSLANMTVFSNAGNVINENDFGGTGMPHVVVMGGTNHKIYYNTKNAATNDQVGITKAIDSVFAGLNVASLENNSRFSVSPNPVTTSFTINHSEPVKNITVTSVTGQLVKEETFSKGKMNPVINITGITAGVYTVKVTDANGQTGIQKIVKE